MKFIDTHCHLYADEFNHDIEDVIKRGLASGVERFYLPAIDSTTLEAMLQLEEKFPGKCFSMIGLHPCSVKANYKNELQIVERLLSQRKFPAIGETGLDFYWDKTFTEEQYNAFQQQINWAKLYNLPIVIHSRESMEQCIAMVQKNQDGRLKGIFHCFSGNETDAKKIIDFGFYLGIGGVVTYKKSNLPGVLKNIDLKYLVLETDSPYLSPVSFRGKRNESSYLIYVAQKLADIKSITVDEIAAITTANAEKIFSN